MKSFFQKFRDRQSTPQPLIAVHISKSAILHNIAVFAKKVPKLQIAPVLKSNAYGHGLLLVAKILEKNPSVGFLVVDSYYEARVLRTEGIHTPLLVMGHTDTKTILESPFSRVSFAVGTLSQITELAKSTQRTPPLHIKIDTGMHRQGIQPHEVPVALQLVTSNDLMRIEGLCSHLSDADSDDSAFTQKQIETWNGIVKIWREKVPNTKWFHLSATKGSRYADAIDANVLRLGIGLYGIDPAGEEKDLKLALSLHTKITALRTIPAGESVGYNRTFTTTRETKIATIPTGYFEGIDRRLSNKGVVQVNGAMCPIAGRVSMNMATIDVTDSGSVKEGDGVLVISAEAGAPNSAQKMAETSGTIPYDILVHIPPHLKRIVEK